MTGSSTDRPSGLQRLTDAGRGLSGVRDVIDRLRSPSDRNARRRPEGGDVRAAVLTTLAEQPADGYRIVRTLQERGHGAPTPGAGSVYPTLQLLADEGLATATDTDGKKTWSLTDAGRAAADAARDRSDSSASGPSGSGAAAPRAARRGAIARSGGQLAQAAALAAQSGSQDQIAEVVAVLDAARRDVLAVLARR